MRGLDACLNGFEERTHALGKVFPSEEFSGLYQRERPLHLVFEFPHVPGPGMGEK